MTLLHNMSAPPRTAVQLQGRPVTSRVTVYSLPFALIMADLVRVGAKGQGLTVNILDHAASTTIPVTERFKSSADLFRQIGAPVFPEVTFDFLVGWRPTADHLGIRVEQMLDDRPGPKLTWKLPSFCPDPRRCAGVLSRCVGALYLARRSPCLTWDSLLAAPIAFDEPFFGAP